jgi:hypothetical protein
VHTIGSHAFQGRIHDPEYLGSALCSLVQLASFQRALQTPAVQQQLQSWCYSTQSSWDSNV